MTGRFLAVLLLLLPAPVLAIDFTDPAQAAAWLTGRPVPVAVAEVAASPDWDGGLGDLLLLGLFGVYRHVLSPQDMDVCNFSPSCSVYAQRAIARHGLVRGVLQGADRLLRDHPFAAGRYPVDATSGRLSDPAEDGCLACGH